MPEIERNKVEPLWTEEEAAAYLGVQPSTVRTWVKRGKIPVRKVNSLNRFHKDDLDEWSRAGNRPTDDETEAA